MVKRKIVVWERPYPGGHLSPSYPICVKKRELWAISREVSVSSLPQTGDLFVLSQREWGVNACFKLTKHCSQISHHAHTSAHTPFLSIATVRAGCLFLLHQSFISLLSGSISAASPPSFCPRVSPHRANRHIAVVHTACGKSSSHYHNTIF